MEAVAVGSEDAIFIFKWRLYLGRHEFDQKHQGLSYLTTLVVRLFYIFKKAMTFCLTIWLAI